MDDWKGPKPTSTELIAGMTVFAVLVKSIQSKSKLCMRLGLNQYIANGMAGRENKRVQWMTITYKLLNACTCATMLK